MSYFVIALLVTLGAFFVPTILATLSLSSKKGRVIILGIIVTIPMFLLSFLILWKVHGGVYGPAPLAISILLNLIVSGTFCAAMAQDGRKSIIPLSIAGVYLLYMFGVVLLREANAFGTARGKGKMLGDVEVVDKLSDVIEPADTAHICQVSEGMAKKYAQAALSEFQTEDNVAPGSRYSVGEPTKQFVDNHLWWIFPLEFKDWLNWRKMPYIAGYLRVSAENPLGEAQAVQVNKNGEDIRIQYLNSACYEFNAERYLREKCGQMTTILKDWTFEPDDEWNPYYTVSILERKYGWSYYEVTGVLALNLQTGERKEYSIDELPSWIDRGVPLDVIDTHAKTWGLYQSAGCWYVNFIRKDHSKKMTPGWFLTYNHQAGSCNWYTGFTSCDDSDQAFLGFMLVNARKGKATFVKTKGVTEAIIDEAARALWGEMANYHPTEFVPYNIYGILTYVVPMTENGQFVGISLVDVENKIKARGVTLDEALVNYRSKISMSNALGVVPSAGMPDRLTMDGTLDRVGSPVVVGKLIAYPFTLQGVQKIYRAIYSSDNPECSVMRKGDAVKISFMATDEKVVTCEMFDLLELETVTDTPEQARYEQARATAKKETDRVSTQKEREKLLRSDDLKKIDPAVLRKFLEEESAKTD